MAPSSKALVLMFVVLMSLAMLPMLPLFLGVDDAYMEHYERYMSAIENLSDGVDIGVSFVDIFIIYGIMSYVEGRAIEGWTSQLVSIWFIGGAILLACGIIGEYVGKIYTEVKRRPRYFIQDQAGMKD